VHGNGPETTACTAPLPDVCVFFVHLCFYKSYLWILQIQLVDFFISFLDFLGRGGLGWVFTNRICGFSGSL
jgi:hypothetical protein